MPATLVAAWSAHFADVFKRPGAAFVIGLPSLMVGVLIALAHPAWPRRPEAIVTLMGWAWAIKGTVYLLTPDLPLRLAAPRVKHPRHVRWTGALMAVMGIAVALDLLRA